MAKKKSKNKPAAVATPASERTPKVRKAAKPHKTKTVTLGDRTAEIDVDLADLILNCWKLDIDTLNCCQDNVPENWVWIQFLHSVDAQNFVNFAAGEWDEDPKSLYNRAGGRIIDKNAWDYKVNPTDMDLHCHFDEDEDGEEYYEEFPENNVPDFLFHISIRFPRKDLPLVKERLQAAVDEMEEDAENCTCPGCAAKKQQNNSLLN